MTTGSSGAADGSAPVDVSVIIITWNSATWIGRCLAALPAACEGLAWEAIVRDNASGDDTTRIVADAGDERIRLYDDDENRGFAGGVNHALGVSRGRSVMLLNPDCEPSPGSIATLARALDADGEAAGVVPRLVGEDGHPQSAFQFRRLPTLSSLAADLLLLDELIPANRHSRNHRYGDLDPSRSQVIEQPAAAALLLRRRVIDELGPFDSRFYPAWFEDVDYSRRMRDAGLEVHSVPEAVITHRGASSLDHIRYGEFLHIWYRNLGRYVAKWFRGGESQIVRALVILGMALRMAATVVGLSHAPAGRGEVLRAYRGVIKEAFLRWGDGSRSS